MIPKILHQIWHAFKPEAKIPRDWQRFAESWKRQHPDWEYRLWTLEESRAFVAQHYPSFLATYDGYNEPIKRVDTLRVLLLHHFGGVYVDMDVECVRPVDVLLDGHRLVVPVEPELHRVNWQREGFNFSQLLSTAFLASEPGHPFWTKVIEEFEKAKDHQWVMWATGPFTLCRVYEAWPDKTEIRLLPPESFYPFDALACADGRAYDLDTWMTEVDRAGVFGVHHWASTWNRPGQASRATPRAYPFGLPIKLRSGLLTTGPLVSVLALGDDQPEPTVVRGVSTQTYQNREIVPVEAAPGEPRGVALNRALARCRGTIVAVWPPGVYSSPDRLAAMVTALLGTGAQAVALERVAFVIPEERRIGLSVRGEWAETMVAHRAALPAFSPRRHEIERAWAELRAGNATATLDDPLLYWRTKDIRSASYEVRPEAFDRALSLVAKHAPAVLGPTFKRRIASRVSQDTEATPAPSEFRQNSTPDLRPKASAGIRRRPTVLLAWELGGGLGHTVPLALVARRLSELADVDLHFVVRDPAGARTAFDVAGLDPDRVTVWPAPVYLDPPFELPGDPVSHAELLAGAGWWKPAALWVLVASWQAIYRAVVPHVVLSDNAPTARLALRAWAPGEHVLDATIGNGFFLPPVGPEGAEIPPLRAWEPASRERLERADARVVSAANTVLPETAALACLADLYRSAHESFLCTVPELDHFPGRPGDPRYWGLLLAGDAGAATSEDYDIFCYLKPDYAPLPVVLRALGALDRLVRVYVPGWGPSQWTAFQGDGLRFEEMPVSMSGTKLVVTHGGAGTGAEALTRGIPLLLLPQHVEQACVARRVVDLGAGLSMLSVPDEVSIAHACTALLRYPKYTEAAERFAAANPRADVAGDVARRLLDLLGG